MMKFWSNSFTDKQKIPEAFAFAQYDKATHIILSQNKNPHFAWADLPEATKSVALVCVDHDVPSVGTDVNVEGKTIPADLPRVDFYHWGLFDIPDDCNDIGAGELAEGVVAHGKNTVLFTEGRFKGARQAINDYTKWFAGDKEMEGNYFGYDGPCPPWNDEIPHRYVFTLYALDVEKLPVDERGVTCEVMMQALAPHVLEESSMTGLYSLNPDCK